MTDGQKKVLGSITDVKKSSAKLTQSPGIPFQEDIQEESKEEIQSKDNGQKVADGVELYGIKIQHPVYTVICPQTNLQFDVKSLTLMDEEVLKSSATTKSNIAMLLAKVVYNNCVNKPEHITDFDSFLHGITVQDEVALVFGLYHMSYGELTDINFKCIACEQENSVSIPTESLFSIDFYPGKDILTKTVEVPGLMGQEISAHIGVSTPGNEIEVVEMIESMPNKDLVNLTEKLLIVKSFTLPGKEISDIPGKIHILTNLGAKDNKRLNKAYIENFDKYKMDLSTKIKCKQCMKVNTVNVNLFEHFFRMVHE
jgi:hypothetical protein